MSDGKDYDLSDEEKALEAEAQADTGEPEPEAEEAPEDAKAEAGEAEAPESAEAGEEEEPKPEEKEPKQVSLQALDAERHKRKSVEAELSELKQQFGQFVQAIQSGQQQQEQPQDDEAPDAVMEPDKFKAWLRQQLRGASQPVQQLQEQYQRAQQYQQQMAGLRNWAAQHEEHFKQEHPDKDYDGALSFMRERVAQNLNLLGYSPQEVRNMVAQEEAKVVALAQQRQINPAAYLYEVARASGFQEKQQQNEAENLERLAETQRQTKSAASAGGQPRDEEYTMERLAAMSERELAKVPDEVIRRVMGG